MLLTGQLDIGFSIHSSLDTNNLLCLLVYYDTYEYEKVHSVMYGRMGVELPCLSRYTALQEPSRFAIQKLHKPSLSEFVVVVFIDT